MKKEKKSKHVGSTKKKIVDDEYDESYHTPKKWFEEVAEDPKLFAPVTEQVLIELKDEAKKCHESAVAHYNIKNSKQNSNYQWMKTVMSKGTVTDKIASHTVTIQDSPISNLETLRSLISMVKVGKKKECLAVMDTLTQLFLDDLLRQDMKLKAFHQRPLSLVNDLSSGNAITRRKLLSAWYFEDQLKECYSTFILALNGVAHDTVDSNKEKAISAMYKLLAGNPEQEKNLLAHIVNKLGDPSQKVASKAIYCLGQLLFKHSNMQGVVLNEIEKLIFRSNISTRSQYYGLCFLSQFYLSHEDSGVARRLIEVYFAFFKACVKKGDVDSRMMSALLMGVNRAYPYAKLEMEKISEHLDTIYRVVHMATFNVSLHALTLLYQVSDYANNISNRYYSALYKKLIDPQLMTTTHQALLLSLIYKSLLKDTELERVKAFIKRLLQISSYMQASFACGILYLVSQVIGKKPDIQSLILKQGSLDSLDDDNDNEEEIYHDIEEPAIKEEIIDEDITENGPEQVQSSSEQNPAEVISVEIEDVKPEVEELKTVEGGLGWFHCKTIKKENNRNAQDYNPLNRNPLYAGAEFSANVELNYLRTHFHPTVSLYANNILNGEIVKYSGDPLKDFTLIRFLDRFVFKNPKRSDINLNQGAHPTFGKRKMYQPKGVKSLSVNSSSYLQEDFKNIPVDEKFLHMYLSKKYKDKLIKDEDEESDVESVASDEFEDMLDKMSYTKDLDDELDFMNDIGDKLLKKKHGKEDKESGDEESEVEEGSDEDFEDDLEDTEEFDDLEDDDKELLDGFDEDEDLDNEDDFEDQQPLLNKKKKKTQKNDSLHSLFASAEEFATLLEDEGSSKVKPGSSNAFSNKDKAGVKQIEWEDKRNQWLSGYNKAMKGHGNFKGSGNFSKKRKGGQNQIKKKNKKMKGNV